MELNNIKNHLLRSFLKESNSNRELLTQWTNHNNEGALKELNEKFKYFLFKIYLYSYIHKSLSLKAREIKIKHIKMKDKEELSLNSISQATGEEIINTLPSEAVSFEEECIRIDGKCDFIELISDKKLLKAINSISEKQKLILYMYAVRDMKDAEIAKELSISIQAVNKSKNKGIQKIRCILKSE